jgi:hypothetical protein
MSERMLNESAIREHVKRVGSDFIEEVHVDVEALVRKVVGSRETLHPEIPATGKFTTGALMDKMESEMNKAIARLIQNKVQSMPTAGITLGRTR